MLNAMYPAVSHCQNTPPDHIVQKEVEFAKRVWQIIDLKDPQNNVLTRPGNPLVQILYRATLDGRLLPYLSDSLRTNVSIKEFKERGAKTIIEETPTDINDPTITRIDTLNVDFNPQRNIVKLMIMEDWLFDKKTGLLYPKIIAIAPLYKKIYLDEDFGLTALCWYKYHDDKEKEMDICDILKEEMLVNKTNQAIDYSYERWFRERQFYSYIAKVADQNNMSISKKSDFKDSPIQSIQESERFKKELRDYDEDQWEK
jgi:hypothetical protein